MRTIETLVRLAAFAFSLAVLVCCGRGSGESGGKEGSRLQYSAPRNTVSIITLERQPFKQQLISNGRLCAGNRAGLYFSQAGLLERVAVRNGQAVQRGAVIARLDSEGQRLAVDAAELSLQKSELDLYDALAGQGYAARDTASVPAEVLSVAKLRSGYLVARNNLARARRELEGTVLKAPFAGRVADLKLKAGDGVKGGEPFCTMVGDATLDVEFQVMESDFSLLSAGLPVRVLPFGNQGSEVQGRITAINPTVGKNGQITAWASVRNDGKLLDGMNVKVIVERELGERLVVPRSAVVIRDNMDVLFRYHAGRAEWVYVNILNSNADAFAVEANRDRGAALAPGDSVIVTGNLNLADGSQVMLTQ